MDTIDVLRSSAETRQQLMGQFVRLRRNGWKLDAISEAIGVCRSTIANWSRRYSEGGSRALQLKVKGRKKGEKRTLNPEQEKEVQRSIRDKCPEQLKRGCAQY